MSDDKRPTKDEDIKQFVNDDFNDIAQIIEDFANTETAKNSTGPEALRMIARSLRGTRIQ
ncbi:MAG TPA: hypothetical protein VHQ01_03130 [Pyrinomonadaceae bacterium]|nr:hypothetical protein [Pyrinomonadaceae bacterium]